MTSLWHHHMAAIMFSSLSECHILWTDQVKPVSGSTVFRKSLWRQYDVITWPPLCFQSYLCVFAINWPSMKSNQYLEVRYSESRYDVIITSSPGPNLSGPHLLSSDQAWSQTSIRNYDFQKVAMTSLWHHHMNAIMFFNFFRVSFVINWPSLKSKQLWRLVVV